MGTYMRDGARLHKLLRSSPFCALLKRLVNASCIFTAVNTRFLFHPVELYFELTTSHMVPILLHKLLIIMSVMQHMMRIYVYML